MDTNCECDNSIDIIYGNTSDWENLWSIPKGTPFQLVNKAGPHEKHHVLVKIHIANCYLARDVKMSNQEAVFNVNKSTVGFLSGRKTRVVPIKMKVEAIDYVNAPI